MRTLPRLYPITDLSLSGHPHHTGLVKAFFREGFSWIQIRDKGLSARHLCEDVRRAVLWGKERGVRLIVNDRTDIVMASGAAGVHVGEKDLPAKNVRKILGRKIILGVSTHSLRGALRAVKDGVADYIALGPIFETQTKQSLRTPLGPEVLRKIKERNPIPLVAIGGITPKNVCEVWEAGADSAAVISSLLRGSLKKNASLFRSALKHFEANHGGKTRTR